MLHPGYRVCTNNEINNMHLIMSSSQHKFYISKVSVYKWASTQKGFENNTGADQPTHPCSLISAFVIRFLESTISKLAKKEISIF